MDSFVRAVATVGLLANALYTNKPCGPPVERALLSRCPHSCTTPASSRAWLGSHPPPAGGCLWGLRAGQGDASHIPTEAADALASHLLVFAAEQARKEQRIVEVG